jgi:bile acid:Na+ symporter, BASS family
MTATLLLLLKAAVGVIIFAIGMDSTAKDATHLLHRPGLLARSLLAMYALVPLAAFALVKLLTLAPGVEIGLLVLAVSAGAPLLPRKLLRIGDGAYIFSLVLASSLLAIVVVPAWLALLGPHFGSPLELAPQQVAWILAKSFLIPLGAGMLLRWWWPAFAMRWSSRLIGAAGLVLTVCAVTLLVLHWEVLLVASWCGVLALMALVAMALGIGHALGGPAHDDRTALAVACASRHIGIAVLVAASLPGPRTAVIIAVYIVASAIVCIPYLRWRQSVAARVTSTSDSTESITHPGVFQ